MDDFDEMVTVPEASTEHRKCQDLCFEKHMEGFLDKSGLQVSHMQLRQKRRAGKYLCEAADLTNAAHDGGQ